DNDTTLGWFTHLPHQNGHPPRLTSTRSVESRLRERAALAHERSKALKYLNVRDPRQIHWDMIRAAMLSSADTVIFPLQDLLGLGTEARMNVPGVAENNWRWRFHDRDLEPSIAHQMKELVTLSD